MMCNLLIIMIVVSQLTSIIKINFKLSNYQYCTYLYLLGIYDRDCTLGLILFCTFCVQTCAWKVIIYRRNNIANTLCKFRENIF